MAPKNIKWNTTKTSGKSDNFYQPSTNQINQVSCLMYVLAN